MSSNSSIAAPELLHLVEHSGKRLLHAKRLLDLIGADKGILGVFQEARALVVTHELDERRRVRLPVLGKALEVFENGTKAQLREQSDGVLGVFVEVGIEDPLVHKI